MPTFRVELEDGRKFDLEADVAPTEQEVLQALGEGGPQDSGQGYVSSLASSAARGAARIAADIPGGIGYLTGSETLVQAAEDIEGAINEALPVNPIYQEDFAMKAANAVGQGASMLVTGGAGGLAGRALGAARTGAEIASLGSAFLGGARGGGQEAEQYGMEGVNAYLRTLGGGFTELATEKLLFGLGDETRLVSNLASETVESTALRPFSLLGGAVDDLPPLLRAPLTEGAEEFVAGAAGNFQTSVLAPDGVETPGIFEGGLENFALGAIAGGAIGGFNELLGPEPTAPLKPVKAVIDGQVVMRGEEGVLYKVVTPTEENPQVLRPINPVTEPLLAAKADQLFYETEGAEAPGVNIETFTVDEAAAALLEAAPTIAEQNAPTETTPTSSETIPDAPPPAVVETPPAPEVIPLEDEVPPTPGEIVPPETPVAEEAPPPATETAAPPPSATEQPSFIGISNARVDEERTRLGMEKVYEPLRQTFGQWWQSAMKRVDARPTAGAELVDEVVASPRVLSAEDSALLAHEQVTRTNAYEEALLAYNTASEAQKPAAEARVTEARARLSQAYDADRFSGSQAGQALVARRIMAARDYSLAWMDMERRAANAGTMTPEQQAQTQELHNKIAELQKQLNEYQTVENDGAAQQYFDELMKEIRADSQKQKRKGKTLTEFLDDAAEKARKRIRSRGGNLNVGLNPADLTDRAIVGASYIAKGFNTLSTWSQKMLEEFGMAIQPYLDRIFLQSQQLHEAEQQVFSKPDRTDPRPVMEQVAKNAAAQQPLPPRLVYELIKEKVKSGAANLTEAVQQATADLRSVYPEITERQVRDEFSGYGRVKFPSQDDLKKRIRELQRIGQLTSAIEDAQRRIAPLRSGQQRDQATQEIRDLQKELTRVMQENGIERTTAAQQLRTALDGVKSRLRNQIQDIEKQLATGEKRKRKPSPEYDAEAKALRDRRDELKKAADALEGPVEPTPEQRVKQAVDALERNIEELERRIREKDFSDPTQEVPQTQHLQVLRDERDALREQYNQMRDEALGSPELTEEQLNDRAVAQLNRAIKDVEAQIAGETKAAPKRATQTPQIRALQNKLRVLRAQRDKIKVKTGPTMEQRIATAEKALEKSIDDLNSRIAAGDTSSRGQATGPETARIKALKAERDSLRDVLNTMKRGQKAAQTDPVAAQLKRDKGSLRRRIEKLEERIKNRDFSPPVKKSPVLDEEKISLQTKLSQAQEEWARLLFEERLANRGPGAKLLDTGMQTLNTARAILTSLDVSAVLRQGGFIVLGNPARGARNLKPMFRAFGSKEFADQEAERLKARENYPLYKQAKLFLSEPQSNKLTEQEEAFMSRWLDKIPTALGGGLLRGSQRAYTVFLNRLRADSFDAMLASLQNGPTPTLAEAQAVARFINVATGRGDLGAANQAAVGLNTVFFAPRLVASRFQILGGYPYFKATPRTKKLILREYAKFLTGAALVYALGAAAQGDDDEPIEVDPRSSDFGKIRFGNTRVDPMSGLIQATVLLSRLATGEKKTASGKIVDIRGKDVPYGGATSFSVMSDFARSKFSPAFGAAVNLLQGRNVVGEETSALGEAQRMIVPMSFSEAKETMEEQGVPEGTVLTILSLFGMGVQTYDPSAKR